MFTVCYGELEYSSAKIAFYIVNRKMTEHIASSTYMYFCGSILYHEHFLLTYSLYSICTPLLYVGSSNVLDKNFGILRLSHQTIREIVITNNRDWMRFFFMFMELSAITLVVSVLSIPHTKRCYLAITMHHKIFLTSIKEIKERVFVITWERPYF